MLTGGLISLVAAFTPITKLEEMVNIGTLMAFVIVCAAVVLLRIRRPSAERPFRTPLLFVFGPLGILVNLIMMLFLPLDTWIRLVVWLVLGLIIYFSYGRRHSVVGQRLQRPDTRVRFWSHGRRGGQTSTAGRLGSDPVGSGPHPRQEVIFNAHHANRQ